METTYLKRLQSAPLPKKITAVVKITDNKALHCYVNQVEIDGLDGDDTDEYFINFYQGLEYIEATKEEFDTLYIEVVGFINELSKI